MKIYIATWREIYVTHIYQVKMGVQPLLFLLLLSDDVVVY